MVADFTTIEEAELEVMLRPELFHHRWAVPILAELHRSAGAKFVTLVKTLGAGRDTIKRTLEALIEAGCVMKNPGYGHPMRPEYILTDKGAPLGSPCARLLAIIDALGIRQVALRKWSMPAIWAIACRRRRFGEIRAALPGVTARALTLALKDLESERLVDRVVYDDYPPQVEYQLTPRGKRLRKPLEAAAAESHRMA